MLGVAAFLLLRRLGLAKRALIAAAIFVIPALALTAWVAQLGDDAPPGAITVTGQSADAVEDAPPE